jgi:putative PIN family toxin of toxin-antitoxin system
MKVVLDTNVLIDGFKDEYSYQWRIIQEIIAGSIAAFANNQTMRENRLIMDRLITDEGYRRVLDKFFAQLQSVSNPHRIHAVSDTEDNKILESAVEARADYLITGDAALLELDPFQSVRIVKPVEFWKIYEEGSSEDAWAKWVKFLMQ